MVRTTGQCTRCGSKGHTFLELSKCPASGQECTTCNKIGHFSKMCRTKVKKNINCMPSVSENNTASNNISDLSLAVDNFCFRINSLHKGDKRVLAEMSLNGKVITMQVDTAADVSVISEDIAAQIPNLVLHPSKNILKDYNGAEIVLKGSTTVSVQYKGNTFENLPLTVVTSGKQALIGLDWLHVIKLDWPELLRVQKVTEGSVSIEDLLTKYSEVFDEKMGKVKNVQASLCLKPDASPQFLAPRQIPYALKPLVEQEILRLEANNTWEKVTYSEWATPLVPVVKSDNSIRICGDYKVTVNPQLKIAQHPLPRPDDMFAKMGGCQVFSKIDLKQAFQQLEMDDRSQEICILLTHT